MFCCLTESKSPVAYYIFLWPCSHIWLQQTLSTLIPWVVNESHVCKRLSFVTAEQSNSTNGSLRVAPGSTGSFWLQVCWVTISLVKTQRRRDCSSLEQIPDFRAMASFGTDGCVQQISQHVVLSSSHRWTQNKNIKDFRGEEGGVRNIIWFQSTSKNYRKLILFLKKKL